MIIGFQFGYLSSLMGSENFVLSRVLVTMGVRSFHGVVSNNFSINGAWIDLAYSGDFRISRGISSILVSLDTNLVDPASSHMLVSKIKPCMSQYKLLNGETANGSLKQL